MGMSLPIAARNDRERTTVVRTIGPHWDGNEVWLLTAGGAMFAAFPEWYATMFSGMYLALFLILVMLILRISAIEWRSKIARRSGAPCGTVSTRWLPSPFPCSRGSPSRTSSRA